MKTETNNAEFSRLSALTRKHLQKGSLEWYSFDMKCMAKVYDSEERYIDKAKVLMIAFYIDLSGVGQAPFVDWAAICSLKAAIERSDMDEYQVRELYRDVVRADTTPRHIMSVSDSLYLLELSLFDRESEVTAIIDDLWAKSIVK